MSCCSSSWGRTVSQGGPSLPPRSPRSLLPGSSLAPLEPRQHAGERGTRDCGTRGAHEGLEPAVGGRGRVVQVGSEHPRKRGLAKEVDSMDPLTKMRPLKSEAAGGPLAIPQDGKGSREVWGRRPGPGPRPAPRQFCTPGPPGAWGSAAGGSSPPASPAYAAREAPAWPPASPSTPRPQMHPWGPRSGALSPGKSALVE